MKRLEDNRSSKISAAGEILKWDINLYAILQDRWKILQDERGGIRYPWRSGRQDLYELGLNHCMWMWETSGSRDYTMDTFSVSYRISVASQPFASHESRVYKKTFPSQSMPVCRRHTRGTPALWRWEKSGINHKIIFDASSARFGRSIGINVGQWD